MARKGHRHHQRRGGGSAWANAPVSNHDAALALANGHPKCNPPSLPDGDAFPTGSTGAGSAPGANGPPTTGTMSPSGPLNSI